jgi:hypothetical protein
MSEASLRTVSLRTPSSEVHRGVQAPCHSRYAPARRREASFSVSCVLPVISLRWKASNSL